MGFASIKVVAQQICCGAWICPFWVCVPEGVSRPHDRVWWTSMCLHKYCIERRSKRPRVLALGKRGAGHLHCLHRQHNHVDPLHTSHSYRLEGHLNLICTSTQRHGSSRGVLVEGWLLQRNLLMENPQILNHLQFQFCFTVHDADAEAVKKKMLGKKSKKKSKARARCVLEFKCQVGGPWLLVEQTVRPLQRMVKTQTFFQRGLLQQCQSVQCGCCPFLMMMWLMFLFFVLWNLSWTCNQMWVRVYLWHHLWFRCRCLQHQHVLKQHVRMTVSPMLNKNRRKPRWNKTRNSLWTRSCNSMN